MLNTSSSSYTRPTSLILPQNPTCTTQTYTPQFQTLLTPGNTPLAMTPNTIKSIEQSILQTLGEDGESYMMESQQYSGNFVPPLPSSTSTITLINTWQGGQVSSSEQEDKLVQEQKTPEVTQEKKQQKKQPQKRKPPVKQPPKKPAQKKPIKKGTKEPQPSEEDDRRRVRRERNKQAAARCRKRRLDHTNKLLLETEDLESKKRSLQSQITELQSQREELEFVLEAHTCVRKIKSDVQVLSDLQNLPSSRQDHQKLKRPNTLNVISSEQRSTPVSASPAPPIPINTPSNGIAGLGFEPLCSDWGVNTPTPLQEGDNKIINAVPESRDLSKCSLVTPVNPYKKLHDL